MSIASTPMTAEQLAAMPDDESRRELIDGELRMMSPAGNEHGRVAMRLGSLLDQFVRENSLGVVYAAETGFQLTRDPDTVRAPDVAFVRAEMLKSYAEFQGFLPFAPDLAAEVVSANDSFTKIEEKTLAWLAAGAKLVLIVDPGTCTVQAFRGAVQSMLLTEDDELDASDVVPGWRVKVSDIFD
jgi:Uma2 family endonuclease